MEELRMCKDCKQCKPRSEFYSVRDKKTGEMVPGNKIYCKECSKKRVREWMGSTEKGNACKLRLNANELARVHAWRQRFLDTYGGKCSCCGESERAFLCIDHINGGGAKEQREMGRKKMFQAAVAEGPASGRYRILCRNCNAAMAELGYCPHSRKV